MKKSQLNIIDTFSLKLLFFRRRFFVIKSLFLILLILATYYLFQYILYHDVKIIHKAQESQILRSGDYLKNEFVAPKTTPNLLGPTYDNVYQYLIIFDIKCSREKRKYILHCSIRRCHCFAPNLLWLQTKIFSEVIMTV